VIGIALTPGSVDAAGGRLGQSWRREVELHGGTNGGREALGNVLDELKRAVGVESPAIAVALLSPFAEVRAIALPPLSESDRNQFLARNAGRYFVGARGPQVVGSLAASSSNGTASSVIAASAPHQIIATVHAAALAAGCTVRSIVPAEAAWAAAARTIWPVAARGTAHVAVVHADHTDLLTLSSGMLDGVRRFRGAADAAQIAGTVGSARVAVLGVAEAAGTLAAALASRGVPVLVPDAGWAELARRPAALAARFAAQADALRIRSDESREADRGAVRSALWWCAGATAAVLLVAAAVHYQGVQRELALVRAARAAIRPQVEATLVGRASVDAAYRQVASLATAERVAPRWSVLLAAIARQLRDDASVTAFRARGDSVFLDGVAGQAAPVFDDMARVPGIAGVRATAPVRREAIEGETPLEHFSLGAQLEKKPQGKR
jgi:hypothetical protein